VSQGEERTGKKRREEKRREEKRREEKRRELCIQSHFLCCRTYKLGSILTYVFRFHGWTFTM